MFFHRKAKKETDSPSTIILTSTGYVHYDGDGVFSISSVTRDLSSYEHHYDRIAMVELTQALMTILIASGMSRSELETILMDFFKNTEDGGQ